MTGEEEYIVGTGRIFSNYTESREVVIEVLQIVRLNIGRSLYKLPETKGPASERTEQRLLRAIKSASKKTNAARKAARPRSRGLLLRGLCTNSAIALSCRTLSNCKRQLGIVLLDGKA